MKERNENHEVDKNFFKAMNYEIAGEIGVIDNEDMIKNRMLNNKNVTNNPEDEVKKMV